MTKRRLRPGHPMTKEEALFRFRLLGACSAGMQWVQGRRVQTLAQLLTIATHAPWLGKQRSYLSWLQNAVSMPGDTFAWPLPGDIERRLWRMFPPFPQMHHRRGSRPTHWPKHLARVPAAGAEARHGGQNVWEICADPIYIC